MRSRKNSCVSCRISSLFRADTEVARLDAHIQCDFLCIRHGGCADTGPSRAESAGKLTLDDPSRAGSNVTNQIQVGGHDAISMSTMCV